MHGAVILGVHRVRFLRKGLYPSLVLLPERPELLDDGRQSGLALADLGRKLVHQACMSRRKEERDRR